MPSMRRGPTRPPSRLHDATHTCYLLSFTLQAPVFIRDRHAAVFSQTAMRDLDADRRLTTLVFTPIHQRDDAQHGLAIEAHVNHLLYRSIVLDIGFQNR